MVDFLLKLNRDVEINMEDKCGQTALLVAVERNEKGIVEELVAHGAK